MKKSHKTPIGIVASGNYPAPPPAPIHHHFAKTQGFNQTGTATKYFELSHQERNQNLSIICFFFSNNSRSKQSKKCPTQPFADIGKRETYVKFHHKMLNSMVVHAHQNFQFFIIEITWFLKNNRALSKFLYEILHYLNGFIKL